MKRANRIWAAIGATLMAGATFATEIAFVGGGAVPNDLSDPDNWGGTLPTEAGVTGIVSTASFGTSYTVNSAVELNGLKIAATGGSDVTIAGDATLSLGAGGLTFAGGSKLRLKAPMAVTAASRWDMGKQAVYLSNTISGTADFAFDNWGGLELYKAPRYGGNMTMAAAAVRAYVYVYEKAAWANTVKITSGAVVFKLSERVPFSTIFPGRKFTRSVWSCFSFEGTGTFVMEDGDTCSAGGDYTQFNKGGFEMTGGTFNAGSVTTFAGTGGTGSTVKDQPVSFDLSGGAFNANNFLLGYECYSNRLVRQTGGAMSACAYYVGGGVHFSQTAPVVEYCFENGTITDKSGDNDRGLMMTGYALSANARSPVGIFTQKGGTTQFTNVRWGSNNNATWNSLHENGSAYGLIDLRGGVFTLPSAGFSFGTKWNTGSVSNSAYDVRLNGGTLKTTGAYVNTALTIGKGDGPSSWDTNGKNLRVIASVDGDGTLRKVGKGNLAFADATRFKGTLDVREGLLEVEGAVQSSANYEEGKSLIVFTADSLASSHTNNQEVTSWFDTTGTVESRKPLAGEISQPATYGLPVFARNVANGHAGVKFGLSALAIAADKNPLAGETNCSFAVVFRPIILGQGSVAAGNAYAGCTILGNDRNWSNTGVNAIELIYNDNYRMTLHVRNNSPNVGSVGRTYLVPTLYQGYQEGSGNISVAVVSMRGNTIYYNFNNSVTNRTFTSLASFNPRFQNANGTKQPLYFGTSDVDNTGMTSSRCFCGYLYEARFYRGRALSESEMRGEVRILAEKYTGSTTPNILTPNGTVAGNLADGRTAPETKASDVSWTPEYMNANMSACSGCAKPELVADALCGKSALSFDAARQTCLNMPGGNGVGDPLAGLKQFAIAFVFRTTVDGTGKDNDGSTGTGIYSSMLAGYGHGSGCSNASITFRKYGSIGGYCATNGKVWGSLMNPRRPCHLNDGLPHVAVYSGNTETGDFQLMVDGVYTASSLGNNVTWPGYDSSRPHVIGALRAGVGHFTGEIFGFDFWKSTLTKAEMLAYCQKAAIDYDFNLKAHKAFTANDLTSHGLGATNITVAAGATLRMPVSATAAYVVKSGVTLSGEGAFEGSYRFADGVVADFGGLAAKMDDVQIASGATMRFGADVALPANGANVSEISGEVTVDITGSPAAESTKSRYPILKIASDCIAEGTTFKLIGGKPGMGVEYDERHQSLSVVQKLGLFLIVK